MPTRRPRRHEDELPELPPLDGDVHDTPPEAEVEIDDVDAPASLDDAAADDLDVGPDLDDLPPEEELRDEDGALPDVGEDDEDLVVPGPGSWVGDDGNDPHDGDFIDTVDDLPPDDRGEEGPEGDRDVHDLDALPPLDDDPTGDDPFHDLDAHEPAALDDSSPPAFRLPLSAPAPVRALRGSAPSLGVALSMALGVALGRDRLFVVGDAVTSVRLDGLDDTDVVLRPLRAPDADELFTAAVEREDGTLMLGSLAGNLYRRAHDRDPWRKAGVLDARSPGAVELWSDGTRAWARTAHGTLHRAEGGGAFEGPVLRDVTAFAVDAHGGALAAVSARGRSGLRASGDGGRTWANVALPEGARVELLARSGDVFMVASGEPSRAGFVSVTAGKAWSRWDILTGATALALGETDDGIARAFFTAQHPHEPRAVLVTAGVGADGEARAPRRLTDLDGILGAAREDDADEALDENDDDGGAETSNDHTSADRVSRLLLLDRAGRRIALLTARGALHQVVQEDD